ACSESSPGPATSACAASIPPRSASPTGRAAPPAETVRPHSPGATRRHVAPLSRRESSTALPGYTVLSSPHSFRWGPVDCRRRSEGGRSPAFLLSEGG